MNELWMGLMIPFLGTSLGAACVFFMKGAMHDSVQKGLQGFAAGVMTAASFFSLLLPAIEQSEHLGRLSFLPASIGFAAGSAFLLFLDSTVPHMHTDESMEGRASTLSRTWLMLLAVTIHNIPEGMAVGAVLAGVLAGSTPWTSALALSLGIAIQNFPEGAIISMPLHTYGTGKGKSFLYGVLSGAVEPVAGALTVMLFTLAVRTMPYLLGFAAGAMMYVTVEELIPEMSEGTHSNIPTICFSLGFLIMMALDCALG